MLGNYVEGNVKMNIEFLVETCFKGRVDKVGLPYIEHCRKVAIMAKTIAEKNFPELIDDCYLVGMLHDVMEDCDNGDEIVSRYPKHIYDAVKILTHTREKTYREYFNDILNSGNVTAIIVKYCDSCHNSDVTRYPIELRDKRIRKKCKNYRKRVAILARKIIQVRRNASISL